MNTKRIVSWLLALVMVLGMASFASAEGYTQSPYLDGQDLPAVADRLPVDVMVEDVKEIGQYFEAINSCRAAPRSGVPASPPKKRSSASRRTAPWSPTWPRAIP